MLGRASGRQLHALAHNRDPRPVVRRRRRRSIGSQCALGRGERPPEEIDAIVVALVDGVARRLRRANRVGRTVVLRLRFDDFSRATRSRTLRRPTAHTGTILAAMQDLVTAARPLITERGLTLIGVTVANLDDDVPLQLVLPFDHADMALDRALDEVRERFGRRSVTRAVVLGIHSRRWSIDFEELEDDP
jgi:DNA polymerase-4